MKVIGHVPDGIIAQIADTELARICGFSYEKDFREHLASLDAIERGYGSSGRIKIGAEIPVSSFWQRFTEIRRRQTELTKLAGTMRALADLIEQSSPAAVLPPDEASGS